MNVLVPVLRRDLPQHRALAAWVTECLVGGEPVGVAGETLATVVRVATHPRIWTEPTPLDTALEFADRLRAAPAFTPVVASRNHWRLFADCCRAIGAAGNGIANAWLAALAMDHDATLVSADVGFARFPGLRWRRPPAAGA